MEKYQKIIIAIFIASFIGGVSAPMFGYASVAKSIGAPALALSGLASLGHLITLDDEMPGEWSNPDESKQIWHSSILELFVKVATFVIVILLIYV